MDSNHYFAVPIFFISSSFLFYRVSFLVFLFEFVAEHRTKKKREKTKRKRAMLPFYINEHAGQFI